MSSSAGLCAHVLQVLTQGADLSRWLCRLGLNVFSMQLNEMVPGLEAQLPPTDTRRRRDLRALEKGDYAQA